MMTGSMHIALEFKSLISRPKMLSKQGIYYCKKATD